MGLPAAHHRFTVEEYHRMGDAGVFRSGSRVELVGGEIIAMTPIGAEHRSCVTRLQHLLIERLGKRAIVQVQNPIRLSGDSEPEPDIAVLRPRNDFYRSAHAGPAT